MFGHFKLNYQKGINPFICEMEAIKQCESKLRDNGVKEQCFLVLRVHDEVSLDLISPSVPGGFISHGVFVPYKKPKKGGSLEPDYSVVYSDPDQCEIKTGWTNLYPLFKELLPKIYNYAYQLDKLDQLELDQIDQRVRVFTEEDVIPNDLEWMDNIPDTRVFGMITFIWDLNLI